MAKRKRSRGPGFSLPGAGALGGGMAQKLQALQQQMEDTQEALGEQLVEATSGGGVVEVEMTGHQQLTKLVIDPEVVDPEDVEMLQDLIIAAINEAVEKSKALAEEQMGALTGGLSIPGLF